MLETFIEENNIFNPFIFPNYEYHLPPSIKVFELTGIEGISN